MHFDKISIDGFVAALVHGEPLAVPVAGAAQLLKLLHDPSAVLFPPVPAFLEEGFAAQFHFIDALCLQLVGDADLRRDGGVIRPGLPQRIITLHPLEADQDVLHGIVERMAHVKLTGDIRRRNHDGKRFSGVIHLRMEIFLLFPVFINSLFNPPGIVCFGQFLAHSDSKTSDSGIFRTFHYLCRSHLCQFRAARISSFGARMLPCTICAEPPPLAFRRSFSSAFTLRASPGFAVFSAPGAFAVPAPII